MKILFSITSYIITFVLGVTLGMYLLPIISAPPPPSQLELATHAQQALYQGVFKEDLPGSDFLHYSRGEVHLSNAMISFSGQVSPGPDYQLYLSNRFIDNKADFLSYQGTMTRVGSVNTFSGFMVKIPQGINIADFNTVIIWCESFEQFISAARYQ